MEECLKTKFDQLLSKDCKRHTALLISAAQIDIQADPLLHRACAIDLVTYCNDVPSGEGRRNLPFLHFLSVSLRRFWGLQSLKVFLQLLKLVVGLLEFSIHLEIESLLNPKQSILRKLL